MSDAQASTAARVTLRQLCRLGLPGALLLPSLLPVLRTIVVADHAGFFFCDERGSIQNLYAERLLEPQVMAGFHDRHSSERFRQQYLARLRAPQPVSRRSVDAQELASTYYAEVLRPLGIAHFLYAIVRHQGRAIGQLSLYRGEQSPPFAAEDEQAMQGVLHYLGAALAEPAPPHLREVHEQTVEEGLAVLDVQGRVLFADPHWPRLIRMAHGNAIAPATAHIDGETLPRFVHAVLQGVLSAPDAIHLVQTEWGQFAFRRHAMSSGQGQNATALLVSRMAAEPLRLAQGAAALGLSPQQREVAVFMAQGHTNADIALALGVSANTAAYHVKQVFGRLDVHERSEVARRLLAAATPH